MHPKQKHVDVIVINDSDDDGVSQSTKKPINRKRTYSQSGPSRALGSRELAPFQSKNAPTPSTKRSRTSDMQQKRVSNASNSAHELLALKEQLAKMSMRELDLLQENSQLIIALEGQKVGYFTLHMIYCLTGLGIINEICSGGPNCSYQ